MKFNALEKHHINQFEYCFLCERTHENSRSFRMRVPKLMPLIDGGASKTKTIVFNNNIFINDIENKPNTENAVTTQNFLTLERFANTSFSHKADRMGFIGQSSKFICCIMDENVRDISLTGNL